MEGEKKKTLKQIKTENVKRNFINQKCLIKSC